MAFQPDTNLSHNATQEIVPYPSRSLSFIHLSQSMMLLCKDRFFGGCPNQMEGLSHNDDVSSFINSVLIMVPQSTF